MVGTVGRESNRQDEKIDVAGAQKHIAIYAHWYGLYGGRQPRGAGLQLRKSAYYSLFNSS